MQKNSIKNITLKRFIQIFSIGIIATTLLIFLGYRQLFKNTTEDKALDIANLVIAGLTSHMKANIMDKRTYFLDEIKKLNNVNSIHIIRSNSINKQFGAHVNKPVSLSSTPNYEWNDIKGSVKATVPYLADSEGTLNCLSCHHVNKGDVLGSIEIDIDINTYQRTILQYSYILLIILSLFALMITFNMFNFMEKYITTPLSKIVIEGRQAYEFHNEIDSKHYTTKEFEEVAENINDFNRDVLAKEKKLQEKNDELKKLNDEIELTLKDTMMAMGEIEEIRSHDTKNHTLRVTKLSAIIAKEYGLNEKEIKLIELTSPLHDIGKIGIGDEILLKPGKLTNEEFEIMETHATLGYKVLQHSQREVLKVAATIAYSHHEKYDGTGYPQGLKGEDIPLYARIVAIVDVLDALLSKRIYKEKWSQEKVKNLLLEERSKHFDPILVDIVIKNLPQYAKIIKDLES